MSAETVPTETVPTAGGVEPESPLQQLPTTRRAILNLLKRQGPLDASTPSPAPSPSPPPPSACS